jgi:hypothetical protein
MALAQPEEMDDATFLDRAQAARTWFTPLNPYTVKEPVLKIEDANYRLARGNPTKELQPLYAYAISAKRYVLFNLDERARPTIRKASAHGLGHLRPPYEEKDAPRSIPKPALDSSDIGVERWEYDVWYRIVSAALEGHPDQVRLRDLPNFDQPAVSRYAATTPTLLRWFRRYNHDKPYREQVKPFNFLLSFQARPIPDWALLTQDILAVDEGSEKEGAHARKERRGRRNGRVGANLPRAVAPYDRDVRQAVMRCFDRETRAPVQATALQSYAEALAQSR